MTIAEKAECILRDIQSETEINPAAIFRRMAKKEYISIHGPEHHILDGASLLVAYRNAGGQVDLDTSLPKLMKEGLRMPGAMCGLWGVCGAITSVGAAIAILEGTGPLSTDGSWGDHMKYTSAAIADMSAINGPRCCKRDGLIAFRNAIPYIKERFGVELESDELKCEFTRLNQQCIGGRCPFYPQGR